MELVVAAGILFSGQKVLIAKRKKGKHLAGFWEFPGGKIEPLESPAETLIREFNEEFSVSIRVTNKFHENRHQYSGKSIRLISYMAEHVDGDFKLNDHEAIEWVNISDLEKYTLAPADIPIAEKLISLNTVNRSYYSNSIKNFISTPNNEILGSLLSNHSNRSLEDLQRNAWINQIAILKSSLTEIEGQIYFEFTIPRMGKRVDNIVIINDTIFVVEFKVGLKNFDKTAEDQVIDYCLDLANFHSGSHEAKLVPLIVATEAQSVEYIKNEVLEFLHPARANSSNLVNVLRDFDEPYGQNVNPKEWESSAYKPTPTIIEAAQALYQGHSVQEISRSDSGAINLSRTASCLSEIINGAKSNQTKNICFVTGVPGAGKTLAGLNIANERMKADEDEHAVFLSGNGPLVEVLREALTRDLTESYKVSGQTIKKSEAQRRTHSFIQNIHHFRDEYLKQDAEPTEKVVVFDEAQRAWNKEQASKFMKRKRGIDDFNMSEPEFLVEVMDRHSDWCTIICLIGGGQEINTGEAGIEEWVNALKMRFNSWNIYFSKEIISDQNYLWSHDLTHWLRQNGKIKTDLHLAVSVRSFRSEKLSEFVHNLLELNLDKSLSLYKQINQVFPLYVTRDFDVAKSWLKSIKKGTERTGLVASSGARRLKAYGIDVKNEISAPNWFLNSEDDVRSSYFLEDVATEFDIQGLEIDYVCLAWGANFYLKENHWHYRKFRGTKWQNINRPEDKDFLKNTYRVLLTRARQGMIIFVPNGSKTDRTRKTQYYDQTFEYFKKVGFVELK